MTTGVVLILVALLVATLCVTLLFARAVSALMVRLASRLLPPSIRDRYEEEWNGALADLNSEPTKMLAWSLGVVVGATRMTQAGSRIRNAESHILANSFSGALTGAVCGTIARVAGVGFIESLTLGLTVGALLLVSPKDEPRWSDFVTKDYWLTRFNWVTFTPQLFGVALLLALIFKNESILYTGSLAGSSINVLFILGQKARLSITKKIDAKRSPQN